MSVSPSKYIFGQVLVAPRNISYLLANRTVVKKNASTTLKSAVADSMGDGFRHLCLQREQQGQYHHQSNRCRHQYRCHQAAIQDQSPDVLSFQSQSMNTTDDEETTTLSQKTTLKIEELKRLIYRYHQYHRNPAAVISCVIHFCNNGDNTLLDESSNSFVRAMGYTGMVDTK